MERRKNGLVRDVLVFAVWLLLVFQREVLVFWMRKEKIVGEIKAISNGAKSLGQKISALIFFHEPTRAIYLLSLVLMEINESCSGKDYYFVTDKRNYGVSYVCSGLEFGSAQVQIPTRPPVYNVYLFK